MKRKGKDWSSSEEEFLEEVIFGDPEEEEEEANKTLVMIPIESVKAISTGEHVAFVEDTSTAVAGCAMDGCTIHGSLRHTHQESSKPRKFSKRPTSFFARH